MDHELAQCLGEHVRKVLLREKGLRENCRPPPEQINRLVWWKGAPRDLEDCASASGAGGGEGL